MSSQACILKSIRAVEPLIFSYPVFHTAYPARCLSTHGTPLLSISSIWPTWNLHFGPIVRFCLNSGRKDTKTRDTIMHAIILATEECLALTSSDP